MPGALPFILSPSSGQSRVGFERIPQNLTRAELLRAVTYLRERNRNGQRGIDDGAPLDFVPPSWKPYVCPVPGQIDRPLWEICLLDQLRQALKGGNLNVAHSRAFQPLETYLLPRERWEGTREQLCHAHQLPLDFAQHWPKLEALLNE